MKTPDPAVTAEAARSHENDPLNSVEVIIVGTGFSGLGMGIQLIREKNQSFVMLERAADVGGTWRDNTYPGAACDIQSHLYSYSFRPNPDWSRVYATQPEILQYLQAAAREEGLIPHIRFGAEVLDARWDETQERWIVSTPRGTFVGKSLVTASGHLSDPKFPDIEGIDSFKGEIFHSAQWDHSVELEGKRIGVVGSGASAIQIVPEIAETATHLTVFQRSAPYVIPRLDYFYTDAERGMFRKFPHTAQAIRDELFWGNEARFPQRRGVPAFIDQITEVADNHRKTQVTDPVLYKKLTPNYAIGCKRILISNDYYPALGRPNVTLETDGISHIDGNAVITRAGERHELDVLILSTGFEASDLPISHRIYGKSGALLADHWSNGGQAYACTTVSGFPNLFVMLGPNTGLGAGSIIYMAETQISYIAGALKYMRENSVSSLEVTAEAEEEYVKTIDERAQGTVWLSGGCQSWYVDPRNGRLTTLWPDFMSQFRKENGTFRDAGYVVKTQSNQGQPMFAGGR